MCVKAIRLDMTEELHYKVFSAMFGDERRAVRVKFPIIAKTLGISEEVVRYNVKKLLRLGYIRIRDEGYEPTEKVLFLKKK